SDAPDDHHIPMSSVPPLRIATADEPPALHARAMENLRFIRETMERAASFTAISGWGVAATGLVAIGAAALAPGNLGTQGWLVTWLIAMVASAAISGWATVRKARGA